jgi:hypothetical protein
LPVDKSPLLASIVRHPVLSGGNLISVTPNLFPPYEEPYAAFC